MEANVNEILMNFEESKKMVIEFMKTGVPPEILAQPFNAGMYDMRVLEREFVKLCPDYSVEPADADTHQMSKLFAIEVLYNIGPSCSRNWNTVKMFPLIYKDAKGRIHRNKAFLHMITGKNVPHNMLRPKAARGVIHLTIKQAYLLALKKMEKLIDFSVANGMYPLTPVVEHGLNGLIPELYEELKEQFYYPHDIAHLVKSINQSSYEGGENLRYSEVHVAAALSIVATIFMHRARAMEIVKGRIWFFMKAGKKADIVLFEVFANYAIRRKLQNANLQLDAFPLTASVMQEADEDEEGAVGGDVESPGALEGTNEELPVEAVMRCYICNQVFSSANKDQDALIEA
ncbi:uncharacterized protein LOC129787214 [Lutzomyia longipalpis]|nr:uncharacterized protein LOC129787214 [Lutzomyia longipalpis]